MILFSFLLSSFELNLGPFAPVGCDFAYFSGRFGHEYGTHVLRECQKKATYPLDFSTFQN